MTISPILALPRHLGGASGRVVTGRHRTNRDRATNAPCLGLALLFGGGLWASFGSALVLILA